MKGPPTSGCSTLAGCRPEVVDGGTGRTAPGTSRPVRTASVDGPTLRSGRSGPAERADNLLGASGNRFELGQQFWSLLQLRQFAQVGPDLWPGKSPSLLQDHTFDVGPVLRPGRERLVDDQVLGGAGSENGTPTELGRGGAIDRPLLERHRAERDVERGAVGGSKEKHPVPSSKTTRIANPSLVLAKQRIDKGLLKAKSGEQREIEIGGEARRPPAVVRHASDEAEAPATTLQGLLDPSTSLEQRPHRGRRR